MWSGVTGGPALGGMNKGMGGSGGGSFAVWKEEYLRLAVTREGHEVGGRSAKRAFLYAATPAMGWLELPKVVRLDARVSHGHDEVTLQLAPSIVEVRNGEYSSHERLFAFRNSPLVDPGKHSGCLRDEFSRRLE